jgi:hypothetical protein
MTAISTARFLLRGKILFLNFFKPQSRHDWMQDVIHPKAMSVWRSWRTWGECEPLQNKIWSLLFTVYLPLILEKRHENWFIGSESQFFGP